MNQVSNNKAWLTTGIGVLIGYVGVIAVLWPTSVSFVETWLGGETYNHGFAILPISLWLVWEKRKELTKVAPQPDWRLLALLLVPAIGWLLGALSGVRLFEQLGMVGMLIGLSVALLGWRLGTYLAFPLLFLIFAVPMGEELIPPMMEYTASFTVEAVRFSGIPVFRDGLWFQLPTTRWSVVEACSGVRYVIASVTLGFLYAYVSYHTLWKRLAFIALSAIVPVIANGLRAYMIVMIGHFSDGEMAAGVDHLIYGWVFFGLVMMLLFWIGSFWQEKHPPLDAPEVAADAAYSPKATLVVAFSGVAIGAAFATLASFGMSNQPVLLERLAVSERIGDWVKVDDASQLRPTYLDTSYKLDAVYRSGTNDSVSVHIGFYPNQKQGFEAVAARNAVVGNERGQQQVSALPSVTVGDFDVNEFELIRVGPSGRDRILVWQWHRIAGVEINGRYRSKVQEVLSRLTEGRSDGAWIAIATNIDDQSIKAGQRTLRRFVEQAYPQLVRSLDAVIGAER